MSMKRRAATLSHRAPAAARAGGLPGELPAHVEQVMADLVLGVDGQPAQRPLSPPRVGVDQGAVPVLAGQWAQPREMSWRWVRPASSPS